ncbi:hypothetical protein [Saccharicrinis aurantiacus]|nr:hypothetical protein [Saccharicrinis aurantiacus]
MQQLNEITKEHSASSEELSASAARLFQQSDDLNKQISAFAV